MGDNTSSRAPRQPMPERPADERVRDFDEVPLGYDEETAVREAERCLQCRNPQCVLGCPVAVQIPEFVKMVTEGQFAEAARKIKETNVFPAICGRVCPQERQCELKCVLGKRDEPVAIGRLERFVADYERAHDAPAPPQPGKSTGKAVAVVGSGPAGMACAADLAKLGHRVTVFELFHEAGGVLRYGIPRFRLPRRVLNAELGYMEKLGVEIRTNFVVGRTATVDELLEEYGAVFISGGAGLPRFLGTPGENLLGVYSANEFLTRVNLMKAYRYPDYDTPVHCGEQVIVVGGGNVAMDTARSARRLTQGKVTVVYRRSHAELPARAEEIEHAEQEGIDFLFLTAPTELLGNEESWVTAARCVRMELGEPDESGRRRPMEIEDSQFDIPCDTAIIAVGTRTPPLIQSTTPGLQTTDSGGIAADLGSGATSRPGVFAGGDIVTGSATVIEAMGAGRGAAEAIDKYLASAGE